MPDPKTTDEGLRLAACPFCGTEQFHEGPTIKHAMEHRQDRYHVQCERCGAKSGQFLQVEGAAKRWNMRNRPKSESAALQEDIAP